MKAETTPVLTTIKTNNPNSYGKRTSTQIKSVLKSNGIETTVENMGDGRTFSVGLESNIKNRYQLKKAGFILCSGKENDKYILIKAY